MLPELTPRWNLVVVDDGSTDDTPEILDELARAYPQVSVIHNSVAEGDGACFRRAQSSKGDLLLLRASDCDLDLTGLDKMWKRAASHPLVVALACRRREGRLGARAASKGVAVRRAGAAIDPAARDRGWPGRDAGPASVPASQTLSATRGRAAGAGTRPGWRQRRNAQGQSWFLPQHCDMAMSRGQPKGPNYLLRLKAFALGDNRSFLDHFGWSAIEPFARIAHAQSAAAITVVTVDGRSPAETRCSGRLSRCVNAAPCRLSTG